MMKRKICRCCVMAAMVVVCSDPARADDPPQAARVGMHVFHDRVVAFVDAQLEVLRDAGRWQGENVSIVFLGINNRWDKAWELTQKNFEEGKRVLVVPMYNLPWEKMDLPGAALDHFRTAFPRTPITTRKIGVPELVRHLDDQGVRVSGLGFSSGASFVLQENASLLVRYAEQQASAQGHFPTTIVVNSGGISEFAHADRLRQAGYDVKQTGERALVTAVEQRFADFDPTGLRIPALGVLGYFGNLASYIGQPFGPEGKHGYAAFRNEVNQALVEAADYNTLVKGLTGSENPLSDALADMERGLDRQVALDRSVERSLIVSATLDTMQDLRRQGAVRKELISKTLDAIDQDGIQQNRDEIVRSVLDQIEAEQNRLATPESRHPLVVLPRHRGQILKALGAENKDLRVILDTDNLIRRQVGGTRWSIVEQKDSQEAFLIYDATGQNKGEAVKTVNQMLERLGESGVILVGDPDSMECARLKEAFEAAGVTIKGEVNTKGKSERVILLETAELQKRFGGIAVKVGDEARDKDESDSSDEPDSLDSDSSDLDIDIEKIDGGWKITFEINDIPIWEVIIDDDGNIVCQGPPGTCDGLPPDEANKPDKLAQADRPDERHVDYELQESNGNTKITIKINGVPVWEVVLDENGNVVCQGPPGSCSGGAPALVGPLAPVPDPLSESRPPHKPYDADPILLWTPHTPGLDWLPRFRIAHEFPPLCPPPAPVTGFTHRTDGTSLLEAASGPGNRSSGFPRPSHDDSSAIGPLPPARPIAYAGTQPSRPAAAMRTFSWLSRSPMDVRIALGPWGAAPWHACLMGMLFEDREIQPGDHVVTVNDAPPNGGNERARRRERRNEAFRRGGPREVYLGHHQPVRRKGEWMD